VATIAYSRPENGTLAVHLGGAWKTGMALPGAGQVLEEAGKGPRASVIFFEGSGIQCWDSSLVAFIDAVRGRADELGMQTVLDRLPDGVVKLLNLASGSRELRSVLEVRERLSFLGSVGSATLALTHSLSVMLAFIGDSFLSLVRLLQGRARYRGSDLALLTYECGMQALPIVSLISMLVGLILGFVELRKFGVQIYIADLVGITMAREMGPMMTAMIMTGRTGAAYATQLGTMETGEEVDAFKTLGFSPMEFLVLPRTVALTLMMPLLAVYADLMGILGGGIVGVGLFGIPLGQYYTQTVAVVSLTDFGIGVMKSVFFALLIALAGCFYGMHSDRSAEAVGYAATRSVVTGIVLIVVADGIFAVVTTALGI
jgi:phospholipid/cholesterol/gamma-HCH transport system permease protein